VKARQRYNQWQSGPLTNILLAANIAVSLVMLWPGLSGWANIACGFIPARFTLGDGGMAGLLPVWLTPISSAFLHDGFMHLFLNMLMLAFVGKMMERVLGWKGLAALYGAGIIASSAAEFIAAPYSGIPVIGASGAISALLGAYVILFPNAPPKPWGPIPANIARPLQLLLLWSVINLAIGFVSPGMGYSIAIFAHIGGFAAGLALAHPLLKWRYRNA
jgi:membrane associated rhomboid family serine protease